MTLSRERLLATTYASALARVYATVTPHAGHLLGPRRGVTIPPLLEKSIGNRASATVVGFHICPICIAQAHLLRRTAVLPHLKYCPTHHVAFHTHCTCGSALILFTRKQRPFQCFTCGLDWTQLPPLQPNPDQAIRERPPQRRRRIRARRRPRSLVVRPSSRDRSISCRRTSAARSASRRRS